jgi:hypothetical protein
MAASQRSVPREYEGEVARNEMYIDFFVDYVLPIAGPFFYITILASR